MRTKKFFFVLMPIFLLALSLSLCSCDLFGGDGGTSTTNTQEQSTETEDDTWLAMENTKNVYQDFVIGCVNVAYQGSEESIRKNGNALTFESQIKLLVDNTAVWLALKAKYKTEQPKESTLLSAEVYTDENLTEESVILAAYILNNDLYVSVGKDNKVKIALPELFWEQDFFPLDMVNPSTNNLYTNIAKGLASYVTLSSATVGKYRRSTDEYRYTLNIDLKQTVWNICQNLRVLLKDSQEVTRITAFIADLFDVKELKEESFPEGTLTLTFEVKKSVLSALSFDMTVHTENSENMLFAGKALTVSAVCDKVGFGNDYSSLTIPFAQSKKATEREKYLSYRDNIFSLTVPLSTYDINGEMTPAVASHYDFRMMTRIFQSDGADNFVFLEYLDESGKMVKGVYFYNDKVYFYGDEYLCSFDIFGLGDLAIRAFNNNFSVENEQGEEIGYVSEQKFDVYEMLGYVLKSMTFSQNTLLFSITEAFFDKVLYSFRSLCAFGNMLVKDDALQETQGILDLQNFIVTNQIIFNIKLDVSFLTTLNGSNVSPVTEIVAMLQQADTETEKHLPKSELEIYLESK